MRVAALVIAAVAALAAGATPARRTYDTHAYYVFEHEPRAGPSAAECARALGTELVEPAGALPNHWLVRTPHPTTTKRDGVPGAYADPVLGTYAALHQRAAAHSSSWFSRRTAAAADARRITRAIPHLERQTLRQRVKRASPEIPADPGAHTTSHDVALSLAIRDPSFGKQWHLVNDQYPQHSMNVSGVWAQGVTGKGVITALVDDGLDSTSDDLAENFDAYGSYDYNDHVPLPMPKLPEDHHGTRCAGQIAAGRNNACGVGIAYDAKVAGLRILSGPISDVDEAASLNYGYQNTSIFSCSWGPSDDGRSMEAPGYLVEKAVLNGINNGRGGLGSVFVFASGNGAGWGDQCNFDGYTNSIYSITVSAIDFKGLHPPYSESCAANLCVAYSSGSGNHITTTDIGKNECSSGHGGTSAAAPNAAGVFTLALSVNPDLTWRDMQHLVVRTAVQVNPNDPDWEKTAQGRPFSYKYGFGALDAYVLVAAARDWKSVKPQTRLVVPAVQIANGTMNVLDEMSGGTRITADGVKSSTTVTRAMVEDANMESLEHITIKVWIEHARRGDVEVEIVSPRGVRSILAAKRSRDDAKTGFPGWRFMSVKHWEEDPVGEWTIRVNDQGNEHAGSFLGWSLTLWGSTVDPKLAEQYDVAKLANVFPPLPEAEADTHPAASSSIAQAATSTKAYAHPTSALPTDHGEAEGEAVHPAFSSVSASASASGAAPSMTPTADEGWFPAMGSLAGDRRWLGGAFALMLLFLGGVGTFFFLRRRRARAQYSAVAGMPLRARGTKELYDAFGDVSDEDEDGGETQPLGAHAVGYHSGFLDDEDARSDAGYRDEPAPRAEGSGAGWAETR